jgi:hypothetical protein
MAKFGVAATAGTATATEINSLNAIDARLMLAPYLPQLTADTHWNRQMRRYMGNRRPAPVFPRAYGRVWRWVS